MQTHFWLGFLATTMILNISPGPETLYLISQTLPNGRRTGFISVLGLGCGALVHTTCVALGISALLMASATAFRVVRTLGAAYLLYLGCRTLFGGPIGISHAPASVTTGTSHARAFANAMIVDLTNPKVALFFVALLPQFYRDNGVPQFTQFMILGSIVILTGFVVQGTIVLLADLFAGLCNKKPFLSRMVQTISGSLLVGLGISLLIPEKT